MMPLYAGAINGLNNSESKKFKYPELQAGCRSKVHNY